MAEMKNVPVIRFKGFSDLWDELLLGSISEIKTGPFGSSLHAEDYVSEGEPIITTEHFKQGELPKNKAGVPQVSKSDYERLKPYLLKSGDIVFSRVGSIDINAHVRQEHEGWLFSGRVLRVRTKETIDSEYLHHELFTNRVRKNVVSRAVGQTMPSINTEILKDTLVNLPQTKTEQTQIGSYFQHIDKLISLHQAKVNKLTNLKKAMLEKMFPKLGADVPEIRFKGFVGAWDEFNLVQIANVTTGKLDANAMKDDGEFDFYTSGIQKYKIDVAAFIGPAITIAGNGATVGYMHLADGQFNAYQRTYVLTAFEANREFLFRSIGNVLPLKISQEARTGNIPYIVLDMLTELKLLLPSLHEQEKIGAYFQNLDKSITLHQTELEKLTNLKKACLEKMFV